MDVMYLPDSARTVMRLLNAAGHRVYVVGGSVRDALRGLTPHDYDMTTDATPDEMKEVFRGMRVIETGLRHGTLTVLCDGDPYEITTYRVDGGYADHRHPDRVCFTRSLTEDLARRDFTMNAIAYHPDEGCIDPFGGAADIAAGIIRAVGDPVRRFEEDALRILRCIRFAAVLGYEIEPATASAARDARELLRHVSAERVREEVCKLLTGSAAARVLREYLPILQVRLPVLGSPDEKTLSALTSLPPDPILRLTLLLLSAPGGEPAALDGLLRELRFDNASRRRTTVLLAHTNAPLAPSEPVVLRLLSAIGEDGLRDVCRLRYALAETEEERNTIHTAEAMSASLLANGACYRISDLALSGNDILAHTSLRGNAVGEALSSLLDAVIDGQVPNTRSALLSYMEKTLSPDP